MCMSYSINSKEHAPSPTISFVYKRENIENVLELSCSRSKTKSQLWYMSFIFGTPNLVYVFLLLLLYNFGR